MARIPYRDADDLPEEFRDLLDRPISLLRALANSPGALRASRALGRWARWESTPAPRLRELAILTVGVVTRSEYEYSHHVKIALEFGVDADDIAGVADHLAGRATTLEPLAREVVDAARDITASGHLPELSWTRLETALGLTPALDLVVIISYYNMVVRVLACLDIDVEPEYQGYLASHPLPPSA